MRVHVGVRWRTCPFVVVAQAVPPAGRILEIGCGHGLFSSYLALAEPGRHVVGTDVDQAKIEIARRAAGRARALGARLAFQPAPDGSVPDGPWTAIVIVDVLYLLDRDGERRLLAACAGRLAPGGVLVVKETDDRPRWKAAWTRAQETVAVRVLGLTEGGRPSFTPPRQLAQVIEAAGLAVEGRRVDRGYLHPHHLLVGRSRTATGPMR